MNDRTLNRLFRRFRDRNDGAALAAVFDGCARELLDVACHLVRDAALAEDVVQETFLAAIRGAKRYDASKPVKGWLYGILTREAARARRTAARAVEPDRLVERSQPEPVADLLAAEVPAEVESALAQLPARYREVLEPMLREGRAPEDIARALDRAPGTVRSQIHRGLDRLRRLLPAGLAPSGSAAFLPLFTDGVAVRGLDALRGEVLSAAGFSPAVAAAAPAVLLQASIGALVMSKAAVIAVGAALAGGLGYWTLRDGAAREQVAVEGESASEAAVGTAAFASEAPPETTPLESDGRGSRQPASPSGGDDPTQQQAADSIETWLARFGEAPDDWRHGWAVAGDIAKLSPDEALTVMTACWPHLSVAVKEQALKPFVFNGGHPHALKLLDLAATDASLSVQGRAFTYLKNYAFRDFANDYDAYVAWSATWRDQPVDVALTENARRFAGELLTLAPEALADRVRELKRLDLRPGEGAGVDLAAVIRDAGGLTGLATCVHGEDAEAASLALRWSKELEADEGWLRAHVLPTVLTPESVQPERLDAYFDALARPDCRWAQEPILSHLQRLGAEPAGTSPGDPGEGPNEAQAYGAARALAAIGDPAAIPRLIEVLANDRSGSLGYAVGYFGLSELTGVTWQESYDAAWWLDWWEKNQGRMPAEARSVPISLDR